MIAKIAVSAAVYAIDKPYSYAVPPGMTLLPGVRVMVALAGATGTWRAWYCPWKRETRRS